MRPTYRASRKASTTSSYRHKLRKQNVPAGAVSDSAWSLTTSITLTASAALMSISFPPRLLCALSLSFPISILIYVHLPNSFFSVIFPAQLCALIIRVLCNMKHCLFGELLFIYDPALDVWIWYGIYCGLQHWDSLSSWQIGIFSRMCTYFLFSYKLDLFNLARKWTKVS